MNETLKPLYNLSFFNFCVSLFLYRLAYLSLLFLLRDLTGCVSEHNQWLSFRASRVTATPTVGSCLWWVTRVPKPQRGLTEGKSNWEECHRAWYDHSSDQAVTTGETWNPWLKPKQLWPQSQPWVAACSTSVDSTNHRSKLFTEKKNFSKFQKAKLEFATHQHLFTTHWCCIGYYKQPRDDLKMIWWCP